MSTRSLVLALLVAASSVGFGCSASDSNTTTASQDLTKDPMTMPAAIMTFEKTNNWGTHHLMWHTERQWDLLGSSDQAWAKKQGWSRADIQEGAKGNGLEFLAMHRVMIRILTAQFPNDAALFAGWSAPPTVSDSADPVPAAADPQDFDPNKIPALDKLANHLDSFDTDDDIGLYIETSLRPTATNPDATTTDTSSGIHNYIHNRFTVASSKVDMGDPSVNLGNRRFWRLHGWIESRWTEFRTMNNLTEDDPAYAAAIAKAEAMLQPTDTATYGGADGTDDSDPPPVSLTKFFERDGT